MAIRAQDVTLRDLCLDAFPRIGVLPHPAHRSRLLALISMIEIEYDEVRLAAANTGMRFEIRDRLLHVLSSHPCVSLLGANLVFVAVSLIVISVVFGPPRSVTVLASRLPNSLCLGTPEELSLRLLDSAACAFLLRHDSPFPIEKRIPCDALQKQRRFCNPAHSRSATDANGTGTWS